MQPLALETSRPGGSLASLSEMALVSSPGSRGRFIFFGGPRGTVTTALSKHPLPLTLIKFYYGNIPVFMRDIRGVTEPLSNQLRQLSTCPLLLQ